jgi:creatinine amidohydrolase
VALLRGPLRIKTMSPWHSRFWVDYTSEQFSCLPRGELIAVLPVGAVEQHGPHMPISTDIATIEGVVAAAVPKLPDDLPVLFLPPTAYGKSNEHSRYPGTVTLSAHTLISLWMDIGASVARSGVRKLVFFNAHGGQMNVMDIVTRDLRERHDMMVVAANWYTLGVPAGLFSDHELRHGIHAGDLETSVMLALKPQTVQMQNARRFESLTERMARDNRFLSITPTGKLGWQTQDLNPEGACGDATLATADKGRAVLDFVSDRFVELLREVQRHDLSWLDNEPPWR